MPNQKYILLAVAVLLLVVCTWWYCVWRNYKQPPPAAPAGVENFLNTEVTTLIYTGSYKPFTGKWNRVPAGFKGTRLHYQGMPHGHLKTAMGNTVWLHEEGRLAIYDQHLYSYPDGQRQAYIWSIGRWDAENGGVVGNERNAYAILEMADVPDVPHDVTNLITHAVTHGGAQWGNTPEAEAGGSFAPFFADSATETVAVPSEREPDIVRYTGEDTRLRGNWHLHRQNLWYNAGANLALIRTYTGSGSQWHIQGWTPELDRLGIAGGVLLSADDIRDHDNHVLRLTIAGDKTVFVASEKVANYRNTTLPATNAKFTPPLWAAGQTVGTTNIPGFSAGARRRATLKVRVEDAYRRTRH